MPERISQHTDVRVGVDDRGTGFDFGQGQTVFRTRPTEPVSQWVPEAVCTGRGAKLTTYHHLMTRLYIHKATNPLVHTFP